MIPITTGFDPPSEAVLLDGWIAAAMTGGAADEEAEDAPTEAIVASDPLLLLFR